jgi:hypothetical protein
MGRGIKKAQHEKIPLKQARTIKMPKGRHTSPRCRATHDVPYTLRCVRDDMHVEKHMDKEWREW